MPLPVAKTAAPKSQQPPKEEDIFAAIANAKVTRRGTYMNAAKGSGIVVVKELRLENKRSGRGFFADFEIVTSEPDGTYGPDGQAMRPHPVGVERCEVQMLSNPKTRDAALGNVKGLLCAVWGVSPDEIADEDFIANMKTAVGDDQPFRGAVAHFKTRDAVTKEGNARTYVDYDPIEQTAEEMAARRAKLDAGEKVTA